MEMEMGRRWDREREGEGSLLIEYNNLRICFFFFKEIIEMIKLNINLYIFFEV